MAQLSVFISCVSTEFGSYRSAMSRLLTRADVSVKIQEDFIASGEVTLVSLDAYIAQCDIIIHLVGDRTGSPVNAGSLAWLRANYGDLYTRYPALAAVLVGDTPASYTQWEAYLALVHKKVLLIACPSPNAVRDTTQITELAETEQRQQQANHLKRLYELESRHPDITFANADNLVAQVAVSRLLDLLKQASSQQPIQNLPYAPLGSLFKGREHFLLTLREKLLEPTSSSFKALHGLGGIGKTRLAIEYAWRYQAEYNAVLFIQADKVANLETNLAGLCGLLVPHLTGADPHEQKEQLQATLTWLRQHPGWLLILDNVDAPEAVVAAKSWLPKLVGGHVLLTTRVSEWGKHADSLELDVLHPDDARTFLLERTPHRQTTPTDEADAFALVHELGRLSLALEHAGAYIDVLHTTLRDYHENWVTNAKTLLMWADESLTNDYDRSVAITWLTTFQELSPTAQTLLNRLAWLAADPVPRTLLNMPVPDVASFDMTLAQRDLARYSFLTYGANYTTFSIHRLVQLVTRTRLEGAARKQTFTEALSWIGSAFTSNPQDIHSWPTLRPLQPHVHEIAYRYAPEFGNPDPTGRLLNNLAQLLFNDARYSEAELLMRRVLSIDEQQFGNNHPEISIGLANLAGLLQAINQRDEAEKLFRRALQINKAWYGTMHPKVAEDLSNLGSFLYENHPHEAEPLLRQALAIDETHFGSLHPKVAVRLNNLAALLADRDDITCLEAVGFYRRAIKIEEVHFGLEHPLVAIRLNNLAHLFQSIAQPQEAELLYRRALVINELTYGPVHPKVAICLSNLATALQDMNQTEGVEELLRRALSIDTDAYGSKHPTVAVRLSNLATFLEKTNPKEAERLYRQSVAIDVDALEANDPGAAIHLHNLAGLLQSNNQLIEAKQLSQRALSILVAYCQHTGQQHFGLQKVLARYISLLRQEGQAEAAIASDLLAIGISVNK
jgi:tetratricopeptide (TPR) repeat protein